MNINRNVCQLCNKQIETKPYYYTVTEPDPDNGAETGFFRRYDICRECTLEIGRYIWEAACSIRNRDARERVKKVFDRSRSMDDLVRETDELIKEHPLNIFYKSAKER